MPVADLVAARLWVSLPLTIYALILSTAIAIPLGAFAAARRGQGGRCCSNGHDATGYRGAKLLVRDAAGAGLRDQPALVFGGRISRLGDSWFWSSIKALTLPAVALALPQASILARVMRSSLLETLDQDYIRTARAKGLSRGQAIRRHAMRNAMIPVMTILGLQFSFLLAGAIIIENVFFLPGLGRLIFLGITQRDLIVVESVVMLLVFSVILVTFLVDLAYAVIDPRLRRRA